MLEVSENSTCTSTMFVGRGTSRCSDLSTYSSAFVGMERYIAHSDNSSDIARTRLIHVVYALVCTTAHAQNDRKFTGSFEPR